jgi:outer membrane murein-binding lipoprotein Lpp
MKTLRLNTAVAGVLLLALMVSGCEHKKPVLVMPQQAPPTTTPEATPTPAEAETQPAQQPPEAQPTATPAEQPKTAEKSKPKHTRHAAAKKPGEKSEVAHNNPKKIIPAEPAPTPAQTGQISPGPTPADGGSSQASTDQLLQGAEANLNGITRTLSKDEEAMRAQIKEFIKQSRTATTENDPARAHTLAVKARLLSDELVKQR